MFGMNTESAELYRQAPTSLAVSLFDQEVVSLGRASELAGLPLVDSMRTASALGVPVVRSTSELETQVEALERLLAESEGADVSGEGDRPAAQA